MGVPLRVRRLAPSVLAAATLAFVSSTGVIAANAATSGYVENGTDNPVSAAPPVTTPPTRHCTVTLADHFLSNAPDGSPQNYSGTLTPPADCQGPWSKVVLSYTTSVSGRQYDRSGSLTIGGATVWFGTTEEPSGSTPTTYTFTKDITDFTALLRHPQPFTGGIGNYMSSVYTGNYDQTVRITYYMADRAHPAPDVPTVVRGVPLADLSPGSPTSADTLSDLPRNLTRASLQVTLKGNGCDEQWFTAVPDQVAAKFPGDGVCANSAYREAMFSVDGTRAGAVGTFPHIYSGGIVPTLWRPIPAIDTFDLRSESLDLTPFVGRLVDGGSHTVSVAMDPIGDTWNVTANFFGWTDPHRAQTRGALTTDDVAAQPTTHTTSSGDGPVRYRETASRRDVTAGWVDTSRGRIYTRVVDTRAWRNGGTISDQGLVQHVRQSDRLGYSSVSTRHGIVVRRSVLREHYPIVVDFSAASYVDDQNFSLQGTVQMGQQVHSLVDTGGRPVRRHWNWIVDSTGVLARSNGQTTEADGHARSSYVGTDDLGRPYRHVIRADHGQVLVDRVRR